MHRGVSSQRASSERGTGSGHEKKPKRPKNARRQRLRIPRNEYLLFWGYGVTYVAFGGFGAHVILYLPGDRLPLLLNFCAFKGRNLPGKRCNYA